MHCTLLAAYLYLAISFDNFARKNFTYSSKGSLYTASRLSAGPFDKPFSNFEAHPPTTSEPRCCASR
jgi:hypothetical protein